MADTKISPPELTFFEIRVPKNSETSPEAMAACFQALPKIHSTLWDRLFAKQQALCLEIVTWNQRIYFMVVVPTQMASYFTSQLIAQYPQAFISPVGDYMPYFFTNQSLKDSMENSAFGQMGLTQPGYLPLKTYKDFQDIDPLSTILGTVAKANPADKILIQFLINAPPKNWQSAGAKIAQTPIPTGEVDRVMPHPQKALIEQKIAQVGFKVGIKVLIAGQSKSQADLTLSHLAGSFASLTHGDGNSLDLVFPKFWQKTGFFKSILERNPAFTPRSNILTATELATLYHLPNQELVSIKNIAWGGILKGEPPENLPVASLLSEEEKKQT